MFFISVDRWNALASREVQSYKAKGQPTSNSITCELVITFSAVFFLSVNCTRGTCETMAKKKSLVLYVLLLCVFQDRTTASWMLVFLFWCTFPFFKIKNRSFSNLIDKYLSGGGIADVFSFLLCFQGGWGFRRSAPEVMQIWRLVTEFQACPRSKWAFANLSRTSSRLSGAAQTWESPSVRDSLKKSVGTVPPQILRQSLVRLLT